MNPPNASSRSADLTTRWDAVMMRNYGTPPLMLSHGSGAQVWDVDGNSYLDLLAGIATSTLGHAHPAIVEAVSEQVTRFAHVSNLYGHELGIELAERLIDAAGVPGRVFFCQDGATANEAAYKLSRKHGRAIDPGGGKLEIVAAEGSFHGRTMGSLSVTGSAAKRLPFEPLPGPVTFVPYGDVDALNAAVTPRTAAVFLEPVLGEGGVIPAPEGFLAAARAACDRSEALLVIDEVQSGIGRTGAMFASLRQGVVPDVITLAKGLAGGLPLGACVGFGEAADLFVPGDHGSTFGGNPVSCAAALAVLDTIRDDDLLTHVRLVGDLWTARFAAIDHPLLSGSRGVGLWRALLLSEPLAKAVEVSAREHGYLVNAVAPDAVRLAPPLILTVEQADSFAQALPRILTDAMESAVTSS
ncbi:MAG: acetylornithine transaminase [Actinomycetes bacterium]